MRRALLGLVLLVVLVLAGSGLVASYPAAGLFPESLFLEMSHRPSWRFRYNYPWNLNG
jgi:hypothetical protein